MTVTTIWHHDLASIPTGFISLSKPWEVLAALGDAAMPLMKAEPAKDYQLAKVHDLRYVDAVMELAIYNGFGTKDKESLAHILAANGVMIHAIRTALAEPDKAVFAPVSGFHHASYSSGEGFCTFNGIMAGIACARASLLKVENVLILDGDAHYGNGTDDIIDRTQVKGIVNLTHNAPIGKTLLSRTVWYQQFVGLLTNKKWDLVIYQAGADAHKDDPYKDGYLNDEDWASRDLTVAQICRRRGFPVVFNLAGGYNSDNGKTVSLHVGTFRTFERVYRPPSLQSGIPTD